MIKLMLLQALEIKQTTESTKTIDLYAILAKNFNRVYGEIE